MDNLIGVLAVNYNAPDFTSLLVQSLGNSTPIYIVENSIAPWSGLATVILNPGEKTHGAGLNLGLRHIKEEYVLILDIDCHLLCHAWQSHFLNAASYHDVITVAGTSQKPIRPACVFMKTKEARQRNWSATPGYRGVRVTPEGSDVGILAYHAMKDAGLSFKFMDIVKPSRYGTLNGEEYALNGKNIVYHHWHGSHLIDRAYDYPDHDLILDKELLFRKKKRMLP